MSQYAQKSDLTSFGVNPLALAGVTGLTDPVINSCLVAASAMMDSYFGGRYALPLTAWDQSVTMNCCSIAAWLVLSKARGFNPANPADLTVRQSYEDAIAWCNGVQRQAIHPTVTQSVSATNYDLPIVTTSPLRGW